MSLDLGLILEGQGNDLTNGVDLNQLLESGLNDGGLLLNVVRCTGVSAHRYEGSYCTGGTSLLNNGGQCCDDDGGDADLFDCSLHQNCRAVAGASASGHNDSVNALFLKNLCDFGAGLVAELFLVTAAAHEAAMYGGYCLDEALSGQLVETVDGEHAVDILNNVAVIVTAVGYHQLAGRHGVKYAPPGKVTCEVETLIILMVYTSSGSNSYGHFADLLGDGSPYGWRRNGNEDFGLKSLNNC